MQVEKGNRCFNIKHTGFINNGYNLRHLKAENKGRGTNSLVEGGMMGRKHDSVWLQ